MLDKKEKVCKNGCNAPRFNGRTICLKCINSIAKEKQKAVKTKNLEKVKIKKEKTLEKKINSISYLSDKTDDLWAIAVKVNFNYRCQYCNKGPDEVQLHSHHLFTRSRKSTKWDIDNGICLCASHHTLSSEFSAHKCILEFSDWITKLKGEKFINDLRIKSQKIQKVTPDFIKERKAEIEKFIAENK